MIKLCNRQTGVPSLGVRITPEYALNPKFPEVAELPLGKGRCKTFSLPPQLQGLNGYGHFLPASGERLSPLPLHLSGDNLFSIL